MDTESASAAMIAARILGGSDGKPEGLHDGLKTMVEEAEGLALRVSTHGPPVLDVPTVAAIIVTFTRLNPGVKLYG